MNNCPLCNDNPKHTACRRCGQRPATGSAGPAMNGEQQGQAVGLLKDALEACDFVCRLWSKTSDPTPNEMNECYEACRQVLFRANTESVSLISVSAKDAVEPGSQKENSDLLARLDKAEEDSKRLEYLIRAQRRTPISGTFCFDGILNGKYLSREVIDKALALSPDIAAQTEKKISNG